MITSDDDVDGVVSADSKQGLWGAGMSNVRKSVQVTLLYEEANQMGTVPSFAVHNFSPKVEVHKSPLSL